ncbi:hypothetical protein ACFQS1_22480 [Paractinoplanes rhizophilus]|uniref:Uncharacterized protein n=1 Tax=Paractinoplanes rhizophilus TaxID=1416877 RepID=A0ABW2HUG2_9ACTN
MKNTKRLERREPALYVVAEWEGSPGPRRLAIEVAAEEADGITASVMRRVDRLLADMTAEFNEIPAVGGHAVMVRHYVEDRLAGLPSDDAGYHRGLLDIHDELVDRGHTAPEKAIADAMRIPEEAMRACLQVARQHVAAPDPLPYSEGRNS